MPKYDFLITGMTCASCTNTIQNGLREFKRAQLTDIHVDLLTETASVNVTDDSPRLQNEIAEYIDEIGFQAEPLTDLIAEDKTPQTNNYHKILDNKKKLIRKYRINGGIGIVAGALVMGLSMSGVGLPLLLMFLIGIGSTLLTLLLGFESYKKVFYSFKTKEFNSMDLLFSLSTSLTILISLASFAFPWLPMMFDAPILIYAFRHIGKSIQENAKKTEFEQTSFRNRAPPFIKKIGEKNKVTTVAINDIKPKDIIIIKSGEIIPLDGICLTKKTSIITTIRNGATEPQKITKGEKLLAGMKVPEEVTLIKMEVTKTEEESNLAAMENFLRAQDDNTTKAKLQKTAENILKYFVPTIFALAITFGIAFSFFFSPILAIQCAISILTAVCPCTFGLITPLTINMAKAKAVENGFQFSTGNALQKASDIDTVVFDLNGTLTIGKCSVVRNTIPKEMMPYLQALESGKRNHLIGRALYHYAKSQNAARDDLPCIYSNKYPYAVSAVIDEHDYTIGNAKQMQKSGFDISLFDREIKSLDAEHIVYFAKDGTIVGYAALEDPLRPEAIAVIRRLKEMGKSVYICTGSNEYTALKYKKKLEIRDASVSDIFYECLPDSKDPDANTKTNHIQRFKNKGHKVAMIGDGGNDAPAIHASHLGIAIESDASDPVTRSLSDAIIQQGSLWPIITAFHIAKDAVANMKQNLLLSLSYNLMTVLVISVVFTAIGFALNPAFGALFMFLQTGFILWNANRFRNKETTKPPPPDDSFSVNKASKSSYGKMMTNELKPDLSLSREFPVMPSISIPIYRHSPTPSSRGIAGFKQFCHSRAGGNPFEIDSRLRGNDKSFQFPG